MHIIQKNIIELELPAGEDGFVWQEKILHFAEGRLSQEIESILNEFDHENLMISIEKIEIELDDISEKDFENSFLNALKSALNEELAKLIPSSSPLTKPSSSMDPAKSAEHSTFHLFIHFLKTGTIPWWSEIRRIDEIERYIADYLQTGVSEYEKKILSELFKTENSFKRLNNQFSEQIKIQLLIIFNKNYSELLQEYYKIISEFIEESLNTKINIKEIEYSIYDIIYKTILSKTKIYIHHILSIVLKNISKNRPSLKLYNNINQEKYISKFMTGIHDLEIKYGVSISAPDFEVIRTILAGDVKTDFLEEVESDAADVLPDSDGIYINNAGLVLLAPFLNEYLKACGASDEEQILDADLAMHCLQYLVTGAERTDEHELVLNKILCGLPIEMSVTSEVKLTEQIKNEAVKMLEAVIFYWDILQDTSVDGLRNSFLQRPGKISVKDDGEWLLQVEQAGYDMLLGSLPWTYSVIKLPLMQKTMWVEWA